MKRTTWLAWAGLVLSCTASAASFDCAKAQSRVEQMICGNPEISKLDDELFASYEAALQSQADAAAVKLAQKLWLKERNKCAGAACVKSAYVNRLSVVSQTSARDRQQLLRKGQNNNAMSCESCATRSETERSANFNILQERPGLPPGEERKGIKPPDEPGLCEVYLRNIQYLSHRGTLRVRSESVAPDLNDRIQVLAWEDIDPDKYPALFNEAVSIAKYGGSRPASEAILANVRRLINERHWVFRRIREPITGKVDGTNTVNGVYRQLPVPSNPIQHYFVQVGVNPDQNPNDDVAKNWLQVPTSMDMVFSGLSPEYWSFIGGSMVRINERIYLVGINNSGDVELQEMLTDYPTQVETVCYFQNMAHIKGRN